MKALFGIGTFGYGASGICEVWTRQDGSRLARPVSIGELETWRLDLRHESYPVTRSSSVWLIRPDGEKQSEQICSLLDRAESLPVSWIAQCNAWLRAGAEAEQANLARNERAAEARRAEEESRWREALEGPWAPWAFKRDAPPPVVSGGDEPVPDGWTVLTSAASERGRKRTAAIRHWCVYGGEGGDSAPPWETT